MPRSHSPSVRRRRLSAQLRRHREAAGLTLAEAAELAGIPRAKLGRIETCDSKTVKAADLDTLLNAYQVTDPAERSALHQLAREAGQKGWWWRYRDVFGAEPLPDFEAEASQIRTYEVAVIPGLLQTPEYAEAIFRGGRLTTLDHIHRQVDARMARREILHRHDSPPRLWAVIDEAALRRPIGGPEVMRSQIEYLLRIGQLPNIDIQVLPFSVGAHGGLNGAFTVLDFPEPLDPTIVYVDTVDAGVIEERPEAVAAYVGTFSDVQGAALSTVRSAHFLEGIEYEEHHEHT
ncbi:helix-turn-helix domain-containing protein [Marinactinospora thermotolerans]|uniref:Predicted transcriptional regulators n=1 Tax=Marinactinospora thermotolerans DSM 45154 TaxID=1122192 RepID=A0A1T4QFT0_9ACTN|nr:helix-turn-helix transcriptional regulator [Marinactinospora thermotolerans]SKA02108.1 Predicted transcriptional regulators [Marinactinospora thermotolerans DSM 45154]